MADIGAVGSWDPIKVSEECVQELRDLAGDSIPGKDWVSVNLRDRDLRYPERGRSFSNGYKAPARRTYTRKRK